MKLDGPQIIYTVKSEDNRGEFCKRFEYDEYRKLGFDFYNSEIFYTRSMKNVIRGLHFQLIDPQEKIVSVLNGEVWDVIVDLRKDSETFGKWESVELTEKNGISLYVPKGFAHGFWAKTDNTLMLYQCQGKFNPLYDTGIRYDDPDININWPIEGIPILSQKDKGLMLLKEFISKGYSFEMPKE